MSRYKGKRIAGEEKKTRASGGLSRQQKLMIAVAVVLTIAVGLVIAARSLVVRPMLPGSRGEDGIGGAGGKQEETIDYGEGIQPRVDGERKSEDYYTVLILGRDTGGGGNTDTMLLASYDVTNQKAAVMSIPRDTMVNVSWDVKKINSVYNVNGGGDKGIQAVYKEVAQLVGFEPDYQVVVEWEAVGKVVDAIGGVYFDVPYDMDYHDSYQDLVIEQAKGYRKLSGSDAMQVIRWRGNDNDSPYGYRKKDGGIGDSGRMKVQQDFLKALLKQMLTIQNVANLNKIVAVFKECVDTDLSIQNIIWFAQKAVFNGLAVEDVEFCTMPWKGVSAWSRTYNQPLAYVVPVAEDLLKIVNEKLSPFKEVFTLKDLDIMSVNADGSLRSSTGHLEDSRAAVPPEIPSDAPPEVVTEDPVTPAPLPEEEGGGEPAEGEEPVTTEPDNNPGTSGGSTAAPTNPGSHPGTSGGTAAEPPASAEPTEPEPPNVPAEPDLPAEGGDNGFEDGIDWVTIPAEGG